MELQRMGTRLVISTAAMIMSGVVEQQRLMRATGGVGVDTSSTLNILRLIPQYLLIRASEMFMYITMTEFFNDQLLEGLRSLGSAMSVASMSAGTGSFASSLLVTVVMTITCRGGRLGWIPQDLNKGTRVMWTGSSTSMQRLMLWISLSFVVSAERYRPAPVIIHGLGLRAAGGELKKNE